MNLDILAIGAHPDDVELSCGGTLMKLVSQGHRVGILDLTRGELGTRGTKEIRAQEAAEAARLMGVTVRENLALPDGNIENSYDNRLQLIRILRRYRPEVLLIPHCVDRHPDHEHAHVLARESWFYAGLARISTTLEGKVQEPYRPRSYYHFMQWFEFAPSFVVDVTEHFDRVMNVIKAYKSQFHDPTNSEPGTILSTPEFLEMIQTRLAYYGDKIGKRYGEPFFSPSPISAHDLFTLHG